MPSKLILTIVLLLVVGGIVGAQGYMLYRYQVDFESNYQAPTLAPVQTAADGMSLEQAAVLKLFGDAKSAPEVVEAPKEIPQTDLKLVLVGAINSTDTNASSALIQNGSETKRYYIGDSISSGVLLHEVRKNEVVLKRDNRFETLSFPKVIDSAPAPLGYGMPRADERMPQTPRIPTRTMPQRPKIIPSNNSAPNTKQNPLSKPTQQDFRSRLNEIRGNAPGANLNQGGATQPSRPNSEKKN